MILAPKPWRICQNAVLLLGVGRKGRYDRLKDHAGSRRTIVSIQVSPGDAGGGIGAASRGADGEQAVGGAGDAAGE